MTCAKVGFWVGIVLHSDPIRNLNAGLIKIIKT